MASFWGWALFISIVFINIFWGKCLYFLILITQTLHSRYINQFIQKHCYFPLKTLHPGGFEPRSSVSQADAMTTAPRRFFRQKNCEKTNKFLSYIDIFHYFESKSPVLSTFFCESIIKYFFLQGLDLTTLKNLLTRPRRLFLNASIKFWTVSNNFFSRINYRFEKPWIRKNLGFDSFFRDERNFSTWSEAKKCK
jgi:hypothetical protein